ncbi:MAG: NAD(P)H-dependent oxidoreductase subunit E [Methylococcales bacterium]|nr:NAD(P)H-dependent oxidoreductase subunit E [Methylococcales bacterium]MDD5753376.1 NAD(P)H-dependent oxidoreductase subunit E [Methylococcales bacterium]
MQQFIRQLAQENDFQSTRLLKILRAVQARYFHIPKAAIEQLALILSIPRTQIQNVIEFYSFFHLEPRGKYDILISSSITDLMVGQEELINYFSEKLGVKIGEVRADGVVSLNNTSCTGMCDQSLAGLVNGYALTNLTKSRIDEIVENVNKQLPLEQWSSDLFTVADNIIKPDLLLNQKPTQGEAINATFARGLKETLDEVEKSGLRGRGGAGYTTAWKWKFCSEDEGICDIEAQRQKQRYIICNADEGEPGTFKDRVLLNSYADSVFEGMTVAAAIIGATQGFIYLRGEYLHLYEKLEAILAVRRNANLLGKNILQHGFDFDIEICLGAGAYICGEESALIESLEGKAGIPRNRPPYPVTSGYLGKPTSVNNVETFLAAANIAIHGGDWFANLGTAKSKGTKVLSISGDCAKAGIYEYPFGTTIQTVLDDCGATDVLGVQVGGPSGTFISNDEFERKLAFEDLATGGSFIVFNNSRSILDVVHNFSHFFAHESCGFCTPCRVGTSLLKKQVDKIVEGHGSAGDIVALEELCQLIKNYSHCGLGQTAANPVLTTLERYPELYQNMLKKISYEPGFDLDKSLETARRMAHRDDAAAHLAQVE